MLRSGFAEQFVEADVLLFIEAERVFIAQRSGLLSGLVCQFSVSIHNIGSKGVRLGRTPGLAEQGPLSDKHRFVRQRYTLLPSGDGNCVETTQGTTDGSNPSARGASRAAILQRFSPDNKSFDRPGTASMRHTSKASGGILSSLREMNDSTSCYHAMTAVCHGCTAIDEILQSWLYIHHRRTAIDEVLLS